MCVSRAFSTLDRIEFVGGDVISVYTDEKGDKVDKITQMFRL